MADNINIDWILKRRSIRKYKNKRISDEEIETVLKAAMYAPSAVNRQPWHYIVIDDKSIFNKFMEIHPHSTFLKDASHAILICGDEKLHHGDGYWIVDCAAATENMLLAAHHIGLGACWIGIHPREDRKKLIKELFQLPAHVHAFAMVSLGYPATTYDLPERFKPERIHKNTWSKK